MGTLVFEVIMTLTGLIILVTGKIKIGRIERTGWQAKAIGLSLLLPLPVVLLLGVFIAVFARDAALLAAIELGNTAELGLVLGGLAAAVVFFSLPVRRPAK